MAAAATGNLTIIQQRQNAPPEFIRAYNGHGF